MINIWTKELGRKLPLLWLIAAALQLALTAQASADGKSARYKKQTVVDFEDALIEGKSRKPYSAYLSKQKEEEMHSLFQWDLDWDHRLRLSVDGAKFRK